MRYNHCGHNEYNVINDIPRKALQLGAQLTGNACTYHVWGPRFNPWHEKRKEIMQEKKNRGGKGLLKHPKENDLL